MLICVFNIQLVQIFQEALFFCKSKSLGVTVYTLERWREAMDSHVRNSINLVWQPLKFWTPSLLGKRKLQALHVNKLLAFLSGCYSFNCIYLCRACARFKLANFLIYTWYRWSGSGSAQGNERWQVANQPSPTLNKIHSFWNSNTAK